MSDSERTTKRSLKKSSIKKEKKKTSKKSKRLKTSSKKSTKESSSLNLSLKNKKNIDECLSHLESFLTEINTTDLENLITEKNLEKLQKLTEIENIQVDLFLTKIYNKILSSENFFKDYFADHDDNDMKIGLMFIIIDEAIKILENLEDNVISSENFELKGNILRFIKFMKINLKDDMDDEDRKQIDSYIEELPNQFYSSNYLEIMKYKSKIYKNNYELLKNIENIDELFSGLESYYEQLSAIESLFNDIELETKDKLDKNNYISVSNKDIKSKKKKKKKSRVKDDSDDNEETDISNPNEQPEKITDEELINYGQFIINMCIYQKFHLIQKPKKKMNKIQNKKKNKKLKEKAKPKKIKRRKKSAEEEEEEDEENEEEDDEELEDTDKENEIKNEDIEEEEESEDDPEDVINLFVIDAVKNVNGRIQQKSNENIEISELIEDKYCISLMERKNLFEILRKNIENFKNLTKKSKNPEIKKIKLRLDSYIKSIEEDKYIPINKDNIHSIKYYNNFINNTITVPNRDSKVLYVENTENQRGLLMIEFYLTDVSKDIIFTLNRYDTESELFNQIYTSEKTNKKCKLCIYFEEKSLYQLEFINDYSWFNSKEVNFSISLFKILDEKEAEKKDNINNIDNDINTNNKNDMENNKEKEESKEIKISPAILNNRREIKFYCHNDNMNYTFNCNKIYKKIKEYQKLEKNNLIQKNNKFSIQVYLNKIRFIAIDENNKIKISEILEEKENIITKNFFNKTILDYLNEHYIPENEKDKENEKDRKVSINLFCLNKNLSQISPKIKELISALEDYSINNGDQFENQVYIQFLQKLGFYPDKKIANYEIKYNLFDFTDQCLIYHLFLNHIQEKPVESSTLVMIFEKDSLHMTSLNEGAINDKFKEIEKNWKSRYYSKMKMNDFKSICNFISSLSDTFDGLDLVLCHYNNEEKKEEYDNMFKLIKGFVEEKIDEPINVYVYNEDNFIVHIFKYIELFSEE